MAYQPYIKKSDTEIVELPLNASLLDGKSPSYYLNYNNFKNTPTIPTKTSQLTNDSNFLTSHQDISGKANLYGENYYTGKQIFDIIDSSSEYPVQLKYDSSNSNFLSIYDNYLKYEIQLMLNSNNLSNTEIQDKIFYLSFPAENGVLATQNYVTNAINTAKNSVNENITKSSFRSLLLGTNFVNIANGDNINLAKYMQVGVYKGNNIGSTIPNCPTKNQFKMEVFDIFGNNERNPETQTWVYRLRLITDFNGEQWVQMPYSANTIGDFINLSWDKKLTEKNFALIPVLTATTTPVITLPSEGIYLITYSEEAAAIISNPKRMSSYIISYRPGYTTRSNDDGVAVCTCSATGEVTNAREIHADWQVYRLTKTW